MNNTDATWKILRSQIYIRDMGICIICNQFVVLENYELGHLIDYCNGGENSYDNLAVMHKYCNGNKPSHKSLDEFFKWKFSLNVPEVNNSRIRKNSLPEPTYEMLHPYISKNSQYGNKA